MIPWPRKVAKHLYMPLSTPTQKRHRHLSQEAGQQAYTRHALYITTLECAEITCIGILLSRVVVSCVDT